MAGTPTSSPPVFILIGNELAVPSAPLGENGRFRRDEESDRHEAIDRVAAALVSNSAYGVEFCRHLALQLELGQPLPASRPPLRFVSPSPA